MVVNTAGTEPKDGCVFAVNYEGELVMKRWGAMTDSGGFHPTIQTSVAILVRCATQGWC